MSLRCSLHVPKVSLLILLTFLILLWHTLLKLLMLLMLPQVLGLGTNFKPMQLAKTFVAFITKHPVVFTNRLSSIRDVQTITCSWESLVSLSLQTGQCLLFMPLLELCPTSNILDEARKLNFLNSFEILLGSRYFLQSELFKWNMKNLKGWNSRFTNDVYCPSYYA